MSRISFRLASKINKEKSIFKLLYGAEISQHTIINPICTQEQCQRSLSTKLLIAITVPTNAGRNYGKYAKEHAKNRRDKYESDSDSDMESLGLRGDTIFWRQKMRTFHALLDVNKDGVISFDDFNLLADRFIKLGNLSEKQTAEFRKIIKDLWEKQFGEINPYNLVTVEQYLEIMHNVLNDKQRVNSVHDFLPYLFKAVDNDSSGEISIAEFTLFFKCLGLEADNAKTALLSMDSNNNGKVTLKEFVGHGKDFFLTEDEERDLWEKQFGEINPYNLVTVEQYLEIMHNVLNDKQRVNSVHDFLPYLFKAVDNDSSGEISIAEFTLFFKCLGLEADNAKTALLSMDSNNNGKVTLKEFVGHGKDFFLTEDEERVSKYFWGPLVDP